MLGWVCICVCVLGHEKRTTQREREREREFQIIRNSSNLKFVLAFQHLCISQVESSLIRNKSRSREQMIKNHKQKNLTKNKRSFNSLNSSSSQGLPRSSLSSPYLVDIVNLNKKCAIDTHLFSRQCLRLLWFSVVCSISWLCASNSNDSKWLIDTDCMFWPMDDFPSSIPFIVAYHSLITTFR